VGISLTSLIEKLFLKEESHRLNINQLYEEIKDTFPDKDETKMRHSIRRSIQSLSTRGFIVRTGPAIYTLKEN
jgi:hypothetical protein